MGVRVHLGRLDSFTGLVNDFGLLLKRGILGTGTNTTVDDNGLAVTLDAVERVRVGALGGGDYGLKVISADGTTVIIDGTSNMFKIAATGTHSIAVLANSEGTDTVTLTALGALPTTPAHLSFISNGNTTGANQHQGVFFASDGTSYAGAASGNETTTVRFTTFLQVAEAFTDLDGSSQVRHSLAAWNDTGATVTFYTRYYILKEAAL